MGLLFETGPQSFQGTDELLDLIRELGIEGELQKADSRAPRYVYARAPPQNSDVAASAADFFPAGAWLALENCL